MSRRVWLQLLVLCVVCLAVSDSKKAKKKGPPAVLTVSKLTPYVKCETCMAMGRTLLEQANDIKKEKGGRKKMGEEPILELLESICEPGGKEGEWINQLDVVGEKGKLKLEKREDGFQDCNTQECLSIARACDDVRTEAGESDIAEKIYQGHYTSSPDEFATALCNKMTEVCQDVPELTSKRVEEAFTIIDSQAWEAKKMQKMMAAMGMGGKVYDRNSMQDYLENYDDEYLPEPTDAPYEDGPADEEGTYMDEPPPSGPSPEDVSFSNFVKDSISVASAASEYVASSVVDGIRQVVETVSGKPKGQEL
eukprot:CAMPEP_0177704172 /NCGR_PEP_ID=MMETSP0484_2-20121128/8054_1 /TAXON_ID=354590 /ORGANISM="Rhodomonas lens, Strain RHODO" /LENGTH=307 /DNA_ID=CAMNT_0019215557 /DNA_START=112 /DNA_END=1035 /DNA_ORIENTATION=+